MRKPVFNVCPSLRSTDRLEHFAPRVRTALTQCCAFAVTGPSSWTGLPSLLRAKHISGISVTSVRSLTTCLFPPDRPRNQYCERRSINVYIR